MSEQQLGGTPKELADQMSYRALSRNFLRDKRKIPMAAPVSLSPHEALFLQDPEHRQNGVVRQWVCKIAAYVAHPAGSSIPEHLHDVRFTVGECFRHARSPKCLGDNTPHKNAVN